MPSLLSHLPTTDPNTGDLLAVIETPKGSPNKYDYDDTCAAFRLAEVMPKGSYFPYDFGFIPSTLGDDGDPLDVLVLMDDPAPAGCVLTIRLIGVIEAQQREKGGDWERNDRLHLLDEIEAFFAQYNQQKGKAFKPLTMRAEEGSEDYRLWDGCVLEEARKRS